MNITIYKPKFSDSVVFLSLCSKSFCSYKYVPHTAKTVTMKFPRGTYFSVGIVAYTFLYRYLSPRFVKLFSKKF
jgi:hypothetical protein